MLVKLESLTKTYRAAEVETTALRSVNVDIALYCCGAYRAMNAAALNFYQVLRKEGTQKNAVPTMQSRADLYDYLGYHAYEDKLDTLFSQGKGK